MNAINTTSPQSSTCNNALVELSFTPKGKQFVSVASEALQRVFESEGHDGYLSHYTHQRFIELLDEGCSEYQALRKLGWQWVYKNYTDSNDTLYFSTGSTYHYVSISTGRYWVGGPDDA